MNVEIFSVFNFSLTEELNIVDAKPVILTFSVPVYTNSDFEMSDSPLCFKIAYLFDFFSLRGEIFYNIKRCMIDIMHYILTFSGDVLHPLEFCEYDDDEELKFEWGLLSRRILTDSYFYDEFSMCF